MRGMEKIGRLVAGLLFAVLGMAANTTTSAASYSFTGTNITASLTTQDAYKVGEDVYFTFVFTRTSSDSLSNGEFVFELTDTPVAGSIVSVTPSIGPACQPAPTSAVCAISTPSESVTYVVVVRPTAPLLTYQFAVRPGAGTASPAWLGTTSLTLAAGEPDTIAGAAGTAEVVASTTNGNGLQGYLTAKGKGTTVIYIGVQEFTDLTVECQLFGKVFCVKFTAENASGVKVNFPTDLSDLLKFAVYVNPLSFSQLVNSSIQQVTLRYSSDGVNSSPISNCANYKSLLKAPPEIPCIDKRTELSAKAAAALGVAAGTWQFILLGANNGFVTLTE